MIMYWSDIIYRMYRVEGKTIPQIVDYFKNPIVSKEYVIQVLEVSRYLKTIPKHSKYKRKLKNGPPQDGTKSKKLYEFILTKGGPEGFKKLLETHTMAELAREWGVTNMQLVLYKRDFVTGRSRMARMHSKAARAKKKQKKIEKIKDIRNLW